MHKKISRKKFIADSFVTGAGVLLLPRFIAEEKEIVMTVNGAIDAQQMGFTLTHEHVMADFIGAEKFSKDRYNADEVFTTGSMGELTKVKMIDGRKIENKFSTSVLEKIRIEFRRRIETEGEALPF